MGNFLIFDIGSNATKASLVETDTRDFLKNWRVETKLGRHIGTDGVMSLDAVRFNIAAVLDIVSACGGVACRCIGTEALRRAANGAEIVSMFADAGLMLEILSASREAELERIAIRHSSAVLARPGEPYMLIDSGGSSTECSIIRADGSVAYSESFGFGQHRLIDMLQGTSEDVCAEMIGALERELGCVRAAFVVAAGSSFTTYAAESLGIGPGQVDGQLVASDGAAESLAAQAGRVMVNALSERFGLPVYVGTFGIRHGWIFEHFGG